MIELWRGCANAWECDELGHLNVRFYLAKSWEAVADLADRIGMPQAFQPGTTSTLRPKDIRIRYLAEAHPGAPLYISGGVTAIARQSAEIALLVQHSASGRMAAAFTLRLMHAVPGEGGAFDWPIRIREALERYRIDPPAEGQPRSIDIGAPAKRIHIQKADALGLTEIGRGRILPEDCDAFGMMMPEHFQGKISNSAANFSEAFPEQTADHADGGGRVGGVLLEGRICARRWPRVGQGYVVRSGVQDFNANIRRIVHWVFRADGKLMWSMQGVAAIMDLEARKILKADDEARKKLTASVKPGLVI
ncbi:thioesterase family protein [Hyphobacterium sp.]|uniref:thioesterase family protein n=1 Tax=Hyphobacterium sp. TaxID=2004662 RepID=UPI003BA90C2D